MKSLRFVCSLILLLVLSPFFTMDATAKDIDSQKLELGSEIEQYVAKHMDTTAGMSVSIFDENETIYRNYFGYMDVENETPVTKETVMEWGSVSKLLVWVSVMQLAEQNVIDLETDITAYLPEGFLKNRTYDTPITMLNLMNHNAGFEEIIIGMATGKEERIISLEEYLLKFQPKQVFEPGTVCAYSNWGTALAAYIVENVSGVPYYEYVRKNVFEPLEMNDTSLCADLSDNEDVKERRTALKIYTTEVEEITPNMSYIVMYPAGMCISTIEDMQKFAQSLLSENTILFQEKDTYQEIFSPSLYFEGTENPRNYHGFWALESFGSKVIGHGGNTAGCSSSLLLDMENQVGMVVQTNQYVEEVYNNQMPELLFGKYQGTASGYSGLLMAARTIFHGPLKLYRLLSVYSVKNEEPATAYDVRTNEYGIDRISCPYGDYFVIGIEDIAMDIIVLGLYLISVGYCLITVILCLMKLFLNKIKGKNEEKVMGLWCMISSVFPLVMVAIFVLMLPTFFNFQQWSVFAYRISFLLIFLSALAMLILITYGFIKLKNSTMKKTRKFYVVSINVCMIVTVLNIFYWNWGMFWKI